ncbi:MAG: SRPBCC domain-containing protein [Xanthobacteraceae bacterium]
MLADAKAAEADRADFVTSRVFEAPRDLVWKCFTEAERMQAWFGPKGSTVIASTMDLRVGGTYHGAMRDQSGRVMWAKFVYREVVAPQRLVWVHSFSDEAGGLTRHPLSPTWPLELLTTVTFEDTGDRKTTLTLRWSPLNATPTERQTFAAAREGMHGGWNGSFERLSDYLTAVN